MDLVYTMRTQPDKLAALLQNHAGSIRALSLDVDGVEIPDPAMYVESIMEVIVHGCAVEDFYFTYEMLDWQARGGSYHFKNAVAIVCRLLVGLGAKLRFFHFFLPHPVNSSTDVFETVSRVYETVVSANPNLEILYFLNACRSMDLQTTRTCFLRSRRRGSTRRGILSCVGARMLPGLSSAVCRNCVRSRP